MERLGKTTSEVRWFGDGVVLGNLQRVMDAVLAATGVALAPSPADGRGEVEGRAR